MGERLPAGGVLTVVGRGRISTAARGAAEALAADRPFRGAAAAARHRGRDGRSVGARSGGDDPALHARRRWAAIWSDEARFGAMLRVEIAVARATRWPAGSSRPTRSPQIESARPRRRRPHRRDRADHRPRCHSLRQPGRRDGRSGGALPPPRADEQRRRRHRPRPPAAGGQGAPPPRCGPAPCGTRPAGPGRGRHGDDGSRPMGSTRSRRRSA